MNSIDTKTAEGKATFCMIQIFHDKDSGYAGGRFAKEWAMLMKRFEEIQTKDIKEVKKEYYACEMKLDKQPTLFINALDKMRVDTKQRLNKEINDNEFFRDILSKLPEAKERGQ